MLKTFIAIMAIFVLGINANAAEIPITFKTGSNSGQGITTSTKPSTIFDAASASYISQITAVTSSYYAEKYGVRIGKSGGTGSLTFSLAATAQKKITKIVLVCNQYGSDANCTVEATLSGAAGTTPVKYTTNALSKGTTAETFTYDIPADKQIEVTSITLASTTKRVYVKSITLYYTDAPATKVSTPTFTPAAGAVVAGTKVSISSTEGATIYYTTDGTTPTALSTAYSAPIAIDKAMTIKAIAVKEGLENSEIAEAAYTIAPVATPTFNPDSGAVKAGTTVSIATSTAGATIYYTTDGTNPSASSTEYVAPITVNEAMTIKAIAIKEGLENSEVAEAAYTIKEPGQDTYYKVTKTSQLSTNGKYVLLLVPTTYGKTQYGPFVMSNTVKGSGFKGIPLSNDLLAATSLKDSYDITDTEVMYLTLEPGTNGWYLKVGDKYLDGSAEKSLKLADNNAQALAAINVSNTASTIKFGTYPILCSLNNTGTEYGTRSVTFNTYTSNMKSVILYSTIAPGPAEPIMSFADAGPISVDYSVNPEPFTNKMITDSDGKVSYSSSAETVAVVDNDGFVTVKGAGTTLITATVAATDNYKEKSLSYTLNVNKATATLVFQNIPAKLKQGDTYTDVLKTNLPKDLAKTITVTCYEESVTPVEIFFDETAGTWNIKAVETGESYLMASFAGNDNWKAVTTTDSEIFEVEPDLIQATCQWSAGTVMAPINDFTAPELQNVPAALKNKILYQSSNDNAITVNENGEIIVRTPGKATITASWSKTFDNTTLKTYEAGEVSTEIVISSLAGYYSEIPVPEISTSGTGDFPLSYAYSGNDGFWYGGYDNTNGGSLTITLTTATDGAQIYYKKTQGQGYDPDESPVNKVKARAGEDGFTLYSAPIAFSGTEEGKLEFYAKTADKQSNTETFQFSIMTGIDDVDADSDARWFNLQGVEVKNPANGIYIRVANGKTTKVIL